MKSYKEPNVGPIALRHEVLKTEMFNFPQESKSVIFGMGCFWGVERLFWQLDGVYSTHVGYSGGDKPNPTYESVCQPPSNTESHHGEVVRVIYFPDKISFETLLATFWNNHDPTQGDRSGNDRGPQYRSIIYCNNQSELEKCLKSKESFQDEIDKSSKDFGNLKTAGNIITTEIKVNSTFYYAEDRHQQYLHKNPNGYCNLRGTGLSCPMAPSDQMAKYDQTKYPLILNEEVMRQKEHGTCSEEVMKNLKWQISHDDADRICCFNRKSAERKGSFQNQTQFKNEFQACDGIMDFHDSVTGKILFTAPKYRTKESVCGEFRRFYIIRRVR